MRKGIGMVPEDRKQHGVILSLSVKENISLTNLKGLLIILVLSRRKKKGIITIELIRRLAIKTENENQETGKLSGGNQQKVSLAKWLNQELQSVNH